MRNDLNPAGSGHGCSDCDSVTGSSLRVNPARLADRYPAGMAASLRVDVLSPAGTGRWATACALTASEPPGSISTNLPGGGRDVIIFRCCGDHSLIERSTGGADTLTDHDAVRVIATEGTEVLARLLPGQSHEMTVTTDRGLTYPVRWTHLG